MSRVEQIYDATLWLGDCREILPALAAAQLVATDPPYGTGGWRRDEAGQGSNPKATLIKEHWDDGATDWLRLISPSPLLAFIPATPEWMAGLQQAGYTKFRWLYMKKLDPKPQVGGRTMWSVEPICVASIDGFQLYGGTDWTEASTPRAGRDADGTGHPYQKPIEVMIWLLGKARSETVLDPFMGSGTTGVACVKLGRKFVGIEREEKYFDIAVRRIEAAYAQPDIFIQAEKKAEQAALFEEAAA